MVDFGGFGSMAGMGLGGIGGFGNMGGWGDLAPYVEAEQTLGGGSFAPIQAYLDEIGMPREQFWSGIGSGAITPELQEIIDVLPEYSQQWYGDQRAAEEARLAEADAAGTLTYEEWKKRYEPELTGEPSDQELRARYKDYQEGGPSGRYETFLETPAPYPGQDFGDDIEEFVKATAPEAVRLLRGGVETAIEETEAGLALGKEALAPFGGMDAFRQQAALVGALGEEEQRRAIAGIPISAAERETSARQRRGLLRQAAAGGQLGGGAAIQGMQELGGAQEFGRIQRRIAELAPLAGSEREMAGTLSGMEEAAGTRIADLLAGRGPQEATLILGSSPAITAANQTRADISGAQAISNARMRGQLANQLSGAFSTYASSIGN